ncbi:MAG: amidase family protein [Actinomycetia bacterium]|nr:amidase family protein [Actinomycetes bacterium]
MDAFENYDDYDGVGLGELVADGKVHPAELVEAAAERIEATNGAVNAVIRLQLDAARDQAQQSPSEGPFQGVPTLIKDLIVDDGQPVSFGSVLFRDHVGDSTSEFMDRVRGAGFIELGRTNTPEFGLLPTTEPILNGAARNPWNLDYSTGGSSGGAAAAVAARMVPIAQASDGGGSIRIPASNCGLFGLKPSRGRNPRTPAGSTDYLSVELGVSRSVRDSAVMLDAVMGPVPGDEYWAPEPDESYRRSSERDPDALTIAYSVHDFRGNRVHPQVEAVILDTAQLLEDLGHRVLEKQLEVDGYAMADAFLDVWAALAGQLFAQVLDVASQRAAVRRLRAVMGDYKTMQAVAKIDSRESGLPALEPFTWALAKRSIAQNPGDLLNARMTLQQISHETGVFLESADIFLTPVLGSPPLRLGAIDQTRPWDEFVEMIFRYVAFTPLANFSGLPAMSVPMGTNPQQLPIGAHFLGRFGDETTLFRLAGQLERARPWANRRPELVARSAST